MYPRPVKERNIYMAVGNLSKTLFFHRQNATSGQNPCVFTCILKDGQFYDVFLMVFAKYGFLTSIQGFPQPSKVRQGSLKLPLGPCGLKVEAPEAQSLTWKKNSRIWTKTNCQPPYLCCHVSSTTSFIHSHLALLSAAGTYSANHPILAPSGSGSWCFFLRLPHVHMMCF